MSISTTIWVTFQCEGIHKYPAALTDPSLKDVEFLGYPHRHIFHFKVEMEVFHDDRDVEFILLKREMQEFYTNGTLQLDFQSCEMMAKDLLLTLQVKGYDKRDITITVSEDGENGATLTFKKDVV